MSSTVHTDSPNADSTDLAGPDLAREMRRRWRAGERPPAEVFLSREPGLWDQPEAAVDLVYEEYCLRQAAGGAEAEIEADLLRRFPRWAVPLRVMLDCHRRVLQSDRDRPRFPAVGDRVGDFTLGPELARGSRGRVFLATQAALADRPVVVKVTPLDGAEHLSLARLQHTNIVPLYSVLDDPTRGVRVLCMPYFGGATLASMLAAVARVAPAERTGAHVVAAIDAARGPRPSMSPDPAVREGPARQMLAEVSYAQAVTWIAACLADALHFAHERGVVHLDLKPSNVLLAADGQPMLLDFHLAREPLRPGAAAPDHFGGTPPYMPPEQLDAMQLLREGRPVREAVDGRADVYALGAILYEVLGGPLPKAPGPIDVVELRQANPRVSRGLADMIARCLSARPEDRYPDARVLAEDLRRHLTDRPLAGVPNRSLAERLAKWRRRRPSALRSAAMVAALACLAIAFLAAAWLHVLDRGRQVEAALTDGEQHLNGRRYDDALRSLERGLDLASGLPFDLEQERRLRERLAAAKRLHLADQLHRLADDLRVLHTAADIPDARRDSLKTLCDAFWRRRQATVDAAGAQEPQVRADLLDVGIFAARLRPDRHESLRILDEAEETFGSSAVLEHERAAMRAAMGLESEVESVPDRAARTPPRTAWDHYALGRSFLQSGDLAAASRELAEAVRLDPSGRWPNFYHGLCAHRVGRHDDAVTAFSVCIGAAPDSPDAYYHRALAHAALSQNDRALRDLRAALALDPRHEHALQLSDALLQTHRAGAD